MAKLPGIKLQCDSIKYIHAVKNAIQSIETAKHANGILRVLVYNPNFNYTNFDISHFNLLVTIIIKTDAINNPEILQLFIDLCTKYTRYIINNNQFNASMKQVSILSKFKTITLLTKESKPKIFADHIVLYLLLWVIASSMILWLTYVTADSLSNHIVHQLNYSTPYLPDIIHDNLSWYFWKNNAVEWHVFSDYILLLQLSTSLFVTFSCYDQPLHLLRLFLKIYCLLLLMRVVAFKVTVLPTCLEECKQFGKSCNDTTCEFSEFRDLSSTFFCNDFIFSGHTSATWLAMMLYYLHIYAKRNDYIYWYEYTFIQTLKRWSVSIGMLAQLIGALAMVFTLTVGKVHYTVDVVIALYLTFLVVALIGRSL